MKKALFVFLLLPLLACGNRVNNPTDIARGTDEDVSYTVGRRDADPAPGVAGTYSGHLPCADCGGIDVVLKLTADGKYTLRTKHISDRENEKDIEAEYEGNYSWNGNTRTVTLDGLAHQPNKYDYDGGNLVQLDMSGKRIDGPLAERYVLKRNNLSARSLTAGI